MPKGGLRPGAGGQPGNRNAASKADAPVSLSLQENLTPRPKFAGAEDFGIWALNASDGEVTMDQKLRAMQVLAMMAGKKPDAPAKQAGKETATQASMVGRLAPRKVRGFGVVSETRQ